MKFAKSLSSFHKYRPWPTGGLPFADLALAPRGRRTVGFDALGFQACAFSDFVLICFSVHLRPLYATHYIERGPLGVKSAPRRFSLV